MGRRSTVVVEAGDRAGFPGAGPGQDHDGAIEGTDGFALGLVEGIE